CRAGGVSIAESTRPEPLRTARKVRIPGGRPCHRDSGAPTARDGLVPGDPAERAERNRSRGQSMDRAADRRKGAVSVLSRLEEPAAGGSVVAARFGVLPAA